jgi:hypothetical protein
VFEGEGVGVAVAGYSPVPISTGELPGRDCDEFEFETDELSQELSAKTATPKTHETFPLMAMRFPPGNFYEQD